MILLGYGPTANRSISANFMEEKLVTLLVLVFCVTLALYNKMLLLLVVPLLLIPLHVVSVKQSLMLCLNLLMTCCVTTLNLVSVLLSLEKLRKRMPLH